MKKFELSLTDEQIDRSNARQKAIDELEYNPMCYDCKKFKNSCKGSKNKVYSGCIYKEADYSKPSIYAQIFNQVK